MEVTLPGLTMVLVIVSEGCALDKGVLVLVRREIRLGLSQVSQHLVGGGQGVRGALFEKVLGDVGDCKRGKTC